MVRVCVCLCRSEYECRRPRVREESLTSPGTGVTGHCVLIDRGTGSRTLQEQSVLSPESSPPALQFTFLYSDYTKDKYDEQH